MAGNGQLQRQGRGHLALSSLPLSPQPPALPSPGQQIPAAADCATKPPSKPLQLEPLPVGSTANSIGGADNAERKAAAAATAVLVLVSAAVVRHSASEKRLVAAVEQHHPMEGEDCLGGEDLKDLKGELSYLSELHGHREPAVGEAAAEWRAQFAD